MKLFRTIAIFAAGFAMAIAIGVTAYAFDLESHTKQEIANKFVEFGMGEQAVNTYAEKYSINAPYSPGELTEETKQQALNTINFIRYTAGLPEVELSDEFNYLAQCASLVNAVNHSLSHYPSKPSGMSDELYQSCSSGASLSNLAMGYDSLRESIIRGFMQDSDSSNISSVGHRRWLLNPQLKQIGVGMTGVYSAVHVIGGKSGDSFDGDYICWPAKNMPIELYNGLGTYAFSVNLGDSYDYPNLSEVSVDVSSKQTGKSWHITSTSSDPNLYLNVNNSNYGMSKCIIFDVSTKFKSGDIVTVTINGLKDKSGAKTKLTYDVNFFTVSPSLSQCAVNELKNQAYTGKEITPDPKITFEGQKLTKNVDYALRYTNNVNIGQAKITITGRGKFKGRIYVYFNIKPAKQKITALYRKTNGFKVCWTDQPGADFYEIQYSTSSNMKNAKTATVKGDTPLYKTIENLRSNQKYYVRVRSAAYIDYKTVYGAWSTIRKITAQ